MLRGGWIVGQNNGLRKGGHVPERKAVSQVEREERVIGEEVMFREEAFESVWIVRMRNTIKNG